MPEFSPPITTISINGNDYTNADFEANALGTFAAVVNDVAAVFSGFSAAIAAAGVKTKAIAGDVTLTGGESQGAVFFFTDAGLAADAAVTFAAGFAGIAVIVNRSAAFAINCGLSGGDFVGVPALGSVVAYSDGTDFALAPTRVTDLSVANDFSVLGDLGVSGGLTVNSGAAITGTTAITGNMTVSGTFAGTGAATFGATLGVQTNLTVGGTGTFGGDLGASSDFDVNGTATVGALAIAGSDTAIAANLITIASGFYLQAAGDLRTLNFEANTYLTHNVTTDIAGIYVSAVNRENWG